MCESPDDGGEPAHGSIDIAVVENTGWLTFNNPARHNALTHAMWRDLPHKMKLLDESASVRAIILRGAGDQAFCAGADISEFDQVRKDAVTAKQYEADNVRAFAAIRDSNKPVIAMIRGHCLGGGFGIAAAAELRLASKDATFAVPAAKLGLAYPIAALFDIVSAVGPQIAKSLLYTANKYSAAQMLSYGFLLEVCDASELEEKVDNLAATISSNAPATLNTAKLTIRGLNDGDLEPAIKAASATFESRDYAEGRAAFRQKRKPHFSGK